MTIEMPEARILASQLDSAVTGKTVSAVSLRGCEGFQRMGFVNRDPAALERLAGLVVSGVVSRGNTIVVNLAGGQHLIVSPEYGGEVFLTAGAAALPPRYHVRVDFRDGDVLTVWIKIMGGVHATDDAGLAEHYLVKRDFDASRAEPDDAELTQADFAARLAGLSQQLKPVLVGRDAIVVGLGNATFQDVVFRAGLHPRRRSCDLDTAEAEALYGALRLVIGERLRLGGKTSFRDLFGRPGGYEAAMGPAFRGRPCPACGGPVQKLALGGGEVYLCPACQPAAA